MKTKLWKMFIGLFVRFWKPAPVESPPVQVSRKYVEVQTSEEIKSWLESEALPNQETPFTEN